MREPCPKLFRRSWQICLSTATIAAVLLAHSGCTFVSRDVPKEFFDRNVAEVREGKSDQLHLYDTHNTDGLLQSIAGMKGVRSVGFEHTDVTAAGFAAVATLPELKQVGFYNTWVNDDCWLDALASSQTLEVVRVHDHFQPPFFSVPKILALPHLRKLRLVVYVLEENRHVDDGRRWTDLAFDDLKRATSLEELELGGEFCSGPISWSSCKKNFPTAKSAWSSGEGTRKC